MGTVLPRHTLRRGRTAALGLTIAGALCLAACGSGSSPATDASDTSSLDQASVSQLLAQAKKEGTVNWYTSMPEKNMKALAAAFEKAYPGVKVSPLFLGGNEPATRVQTEARANSIRADVVSGSGDSVLLAQSGLIAEGFKAPDLPETPGLTLPKGVGAEKLITNVIMYNPKAVKAAGLQPPATFEDLTKPEWRGKFSIDPVTADIWLTYEPTLGEAKTQDLLKRLGSNKPLFVTSHSLGASQVASGTVLAMAGAYGQDGVKYSRLDPESAAFVNPDPLGANVSEVNVVKGSPHPAAARLFMNWEISKAGQQEIVDLGMVSVRTDVTNVPTEWDPAKFKPAFEDPEITTEERAASLAKYQAALGYKK